MEVSALKPTALSGLRGPTPLLRLQSDERLVALTRRGNQSAFETLVARYQARLLAFCRHMLNSREDAEDVLQEVFAAAFNAMVADERPINVRPWLYRIARNRSLNHLRRQTAIGVDSMDIHLADHGQTTADKVHKREEFRQLVGDVQELPETQRTALLLREIDALSYDQIADVMETTVPSVKSLLVRARVALAEMSEARRLTCEEVRLELGEVAEGLTRMSPPVRRHLKACDRCAMFRQQLKETNKALAAIMPVAPLLFLKKVVLAHIGTTASAGGGAAAGAAAASTASAGAASALSAGIGTIASKTAATLAAAAIVTGAAVEVDHATNRGDRSPEPAQIAQAPEPAPAPAPAPPPPAPAPVVASAPEPVADPKPQPTTDEEPARLRGKDQPAEGEQAAAGEPGATDVDAAAVADQPVAAAKPTTTTPPPTGTAQDGVGVTVVPGTVQPGAPTQTVPPPTTTPAPAPAPAPTDPAVPPPTDPVVPPPTDPAAPPPADPAAPPPADPAAPPPATTTPAP
ncbi:MAG TPA: RNA polymerase sigma factor [Capillimicrobium sp.]|nr:RNA polymerase sigma factor [Capillimicrobium sp.]